MSKQSHFLFCLKDHFKVWLIGIMLFFLNLTQFPQRYLRSFSYAVVLTSLLFLNVMDCALQVLLVANKTAFCLLYKLDLIQLSLS